MIKRVLLSVATVAVLSFLSAPAFAFHCPKDVKAIDVALASGKVSAAIKDKVQKLRDEGNAMHKGNKHKESVGKLSEAMRLILNTK